MCSIFINIYICFYDLFCRFDELNDDFDNLGRKCNKLNYYGESNDSESNNFFIISK